MPENSNGRRKDIPPEEGPLHDDPSSEESSKVAAAREGELLHGIRQNTWFQYVVTLCACVIAVVLTGALCAMIYFTVLYHVGKWAPTEEYQISIFRGIPINSLVAIAGYLFAGGKFNFSRLLINFSGGQEDG